MLFYRPVLLALLLLTGTTLSGCATWNPSWNQAVPGTTGTDVTAFLNKADSIYQSADSREKVMAAISAYEDALKIDPVNYKALTSLGHLYMLLAAGYTQKVSEKERLYDQSMRFNEWAMYTNPSFKRMVDQGAKPWEAADVLTEREMEAMFFWITGVLYKFKECMILPTQILNIEMIQWIGPFLKQMEELDETWGGGGIQFSLSLYYALLPERMGGSDELSKEYLNKSVEIGPQWLLNRWGRAKYFYVQRDNSEGFRQDMEWILNQDIHEAGGDYAWKIYIQRDAREMLDNMNRYF